MKRIWILGTLGLLGACGFDDSLREYLSARFWLPFAKHASNFEKPNIRRIDAPFAGMASGDRNTPLEKLRYAYLGVPQDRAFDAAPARAALAAARADSSLSPREKEEVDLIDAKIQMRAAEADDQLSLEPVEAKFKAFLKTARDPAFLSEARGWLAHVYYLEGDQTRAGKIYLDELNRSGSNLSRETLLTSLRMNYRYNRGEELRAHLEEYFDTPEHAIFAIQLVTNPRWGGPRADQRFQPEDTAIYTRILDLLQKHGSLLRSEPLAMLSLRTALRAGDPAMARTIAEKIPDSSPVRSDPDFLWMLASADFLSHDFAAAEDPLLALFASSRASIDQQAAAAYGLCGVYRKLDKPVEQIRYALWLHKRVSHEGRFWGAVEFSDFSIYWGMSGFDLNLLLEAEASIDTLRAFIEQNPGLPDLRLVQYALAVRLARENQYDESASIYESIHAKRRAPRMRKLADFYRGATTPEGKFRLAEFIAANENGIYFNDSLWSGLQRYGLTAEDEYRFTRAERDRQIALERELKDDEEEYWRAYLILRDVMKEADPKLARRSAELARRSLRRISERFGRRDELLAADRELSLWLAKQR